MQLFGNQEVNGQWRRSHSLYGAAGRRVRGVKGSALLTTLCCCGLQAVTTYWPALDQAWISSVINGLVSENHLSGTACLVDLDWSPWLPLISTRQDLCSTLTHRGGMCANTAEKWSRMCGSVCAFFFLSFLCLRTCLHHPCDPQFQTHFRSRLPDVYDWSYLPPAAANADCSASFQSHTFPAQDKGPDSTYLSGSYLQSLINCVASESATCRFRRLTQPAE